MSLVAPVAPALAPADFHRVSGIVHRTSGICLPDGKEGLVTSRLAPRLRQLGVAAFGEYLARVEADGDELARMVDLLTTNKTGFWREPAHFDHLRTHVLAPAKARRAPLRIWSAGCSSGEEPYTLALEVLEHAGDAARDCRILATDLSARVLARARTATYDADAVLAVPAALRARWFTPAPHTDRGAMFTLREDARRLVAFARLNLMDPWPMRGPFDAIFCRNVMIYFDRPTQQSLVERFRTLLAPDGLLYVGHSESLTGFAHQFRYVQPSVYAR